MILRARGIITPSGSRVQVRAYERAADSTADACATANANRTFVSLGNVVWFARGSLMKRHIAKEIGAQRDSPPGSLLVRSAYNAPLDTRSSERRRRRRARVRVDERERRREAATRARFARLIYPERTFAWRGNALRRSDFVTVDNTVVSEIAVKRARDISIRRCTSGFSAGGFASSDTPLRSGENVAVETVAEAKFREDTP